MAAAVLRDGLAVLVAMAAALRVGLAVPVVTAAAPVNVPAVLAVPAVNVPAARPVAVLAPVPDAVLAPAPIAVPVLAEVPAPVAVLADLAVLAAVVPPGGGFVPPPDLNRGDKGPGRGARFGVGPQSRKKKRKKKKNEEIQKFRPIHRNISKVELPEEELGIIMLSEGVTVKELAAKVDRLAKDIIKRLMEKGVFATVNDVLDTDLALDIARDFGYEADIVTFEEDLQMQEEEGAEADKSDSEDAVTRAPIVTIMGHVDHGKTTLLDKIRSTAVAEGESGGITQHIGAYHVECHGKNIVFLDTPGHEAFAKMRARGAQVTDIVILMVAADDGVKPQTIEAINHAREAKVPIVVCINKIDKPGANPLRVKQMLTEHSLVIEEFGGDVPAVEVSAKQGQGIQELLEMILLVAEVHDWTAVDSRRGRGTVIEAQLDKGRGPVASVLVQDGSVRIGDYFITGATYGKIRAMHGDRGENLELAGPSTPIEILGLQDVPSAGDPFQIVEDEQTARQIAGFRKEKAREEKLRSKKVTAMDQLFSKMKQGEVQELPLIIKADKQGSVEGIAYALNQIESEKVKLRIIHQGVGAVTENDVLLALASDALVIAFTVKTEPRAVEVADMEGVDIRSYSIIYEIVDDVEKAMLGKLSATFEEEETGTINVRAVFQIPKQGKIAGSYVETGYITRDGLVEVLRGGEAIHKGPLSSLKRFKDDVKEVRAGLECGIGVKDFDDIREGDLMKAYKLVEVQPTEL